MQKKQIQKAVLNQGLMWFDSTEEILIYHLGLPHETSKGEYGEPGPCLYWDLYWPCSLKITIQFHIMINLVVIYGDKPEIEHILKHLELPKKNLDRLDEYHADYFLKTFPATEKWVIWRSDENGNKFLHSTYQWKRHAECVANDLNESIHKQYYWIENS